MSRNDEIMGRRRRSFETRARLMARRGETGTANDSKRCPDCRDGERAETSECYGCDGHGIIPCAHCDGMGCVDDKKNGQFEDPCTCCGGGSELRCFTCNGEGKTTECATCEGSGRIYRPDCLDED